MLISAEESHKLTHFISVFERYKLEKGYWYFLSKILKVSKGIVILVQRSKPLKTCFRHQQMFFIKE